MKGSNKIKESMNRYGIIFIEHLLNKDCSQVTSWIGVQNNTKKISTGKTLKWFTEVQQTLVEMEHPAAEVLSEVVIDRKKKIHADIRELLEGRIYKEEKIREILEIFNYLSKLNNYKQDRNSRPKAVNDQLKNYGHRRSNVINSKNMTISIKECTNSNQ
ncbi:12952_t:CDS:2, partial [Gigaspora margarita]